MKIGSLWFLLLAAVLAGCGDDRQPARHVPGQILVVIGADYDEPAGQLALAREDHGGLHRLTRLSALNPHWDPRGRRIAFDLRDNYSAASSVWVMNAGGDGQRQLVPDAAGYSHVLDWSPNGRRILYDVVRPVSTALVDTSDLWSMRADGTDKHRLARNVKEIEAAWSPDGTSIAFANDQDVYLMRADGSGVTRLAKDGASPEWLPDAKTIVFLRELRGSRSGVYAVARSGRQSRRLARLPDADVYLAGISPDKRSVLIGNIPGLAVVPLHGGELRRLTRRPGDFGGGWSPDGGRIAFLRGPDLWVMDADGLHPHRVAQAPRGQVLGWPTSWKPKP